MNKKINIISFNMSKYSDWTKSGVVNRNYHILHNLAKDERVDKIISVDFFPFNYKRAFKVFVKDHLLNDKRGEIIYGDLTTQMWQVGSKIYVFSSIDSVFNKSKIITELNKVIDDLNMRNNLVVINFNPLYTDYFDKLDQKINIFDTVDNWATHSSYHKERKQLLENYKTITEKSDLIYTVSEDLQNFLNSKKSIWLPNAVDFEHFQSNDSITKLDKIKTPIIGFLGILQDRIDVELLEFIAKNNPDKTLVLAGPVWKNFPKQRLEKYSNVKFTGAVKYKDIPKYYNSFDVGIIPYKTNEFIKSTNSMKYYEYLASGLPVVSTVSGGIEKFKEVIYISKTYEDFNKNISSALNSKSLELINKRKEFVKNMTWKARVNEILSDIFSII